MSTLPVKLRCMDSADAITPLGHAIDERLEELGWSISELERRIGRGGGLVSRLRRGKVNPTHETIEAIADALQVDVVRLKQLAGLRVSTPPAQRHTTVEYAASTVDAALPHLAPEVQELILEQLATTADLARRLANQQAPAEASAEEERLPPGIPEGLEDQYRRIRARMPDITPEAIVETLRLSRENPELYQFLADEALRIQRGDPEADDDDTGLGRTA